MSIRDSISNVSKLLVKVHDADLKAQLQEALLNAQGEALDLQSKLGETQAENAHLSEELRKANELSAATDQLTTLAMRTGSKTKR